MVFVMVNIKEQFKNMTMSKKINEKKKRQTTESSLL